MSAAATFDHDADTPSDPDETANAERTSVASTEATDLTPSASRCITPTPSASEAETPVFTPASTTRSNTPTPMEEDHKPASSPFYYSDGNITVSSNSSGFVIDGYTNGTMHFGGSQGSYFPTGAYNQLHLPNNARLYWGANSSTAAQASASSTSSMPNSFRSTTHNAAQGSSTNPSGRHFTNTTLSSFNLPDGAIVRDCQLCSCNGKGLRVMDCSFSSCNFLDSTIADCSFSSSNLQDCRVTDCSFSGSHVRGGSVSDCSHSGSTLC